MKICNKCKKENDDNNIVCLYCGNLIADVPKMDFSEVVKKRQAERPDPMAHPDRTIENMINAKERKEKRLEEIKEQMKENEIKQTIETPEANEEEQGVTNMEVELDDFENKGNQENISNNRFFFNGDSEK